MALRSAANMGMRRRTRIAGLAQAPDPFFNNVVALLHFDGDDAATTFVDVKGHTFSAASGTPALDTSVVKWGPSSAEIPSNASSIQSGLEADFALQQVFTLEGWFYRQENSTARVLAELSRPAGATITVYHTTATNTYTLAGFGSSILSNSNPPQNEWVHWAITRNASDVVRLWINGSAGGGATSATVDSNPMRLYIGQATFTANACLGHHDDIRFTQGIVRYTSTFTPPTGPFPNF